MVLYLRAILTWLGFLFNTTAPHIQFIVRQCIFRIRKPGIWAAQSGLQMLLSRLLAHYQRISPKKSNAEPEMADFIAASTAHPVLAPVNDLSQSLPIQANQLQVQVNQHLAQGSCTQASIDFRSPSTLPTEWGPNRFKPLIPQLCQRGCLCMLLRRCQLQNGLSWRSKTVNAGGWIEKVQSKFHYCRDVSAQVSLYD
ncbi:hypothetical protein BDR05DRAFT_805606 [Suillus weaverae]|nr:hypothetical protein BDR05DRAFT_805606 [Suillus weaverae]